jgi:phage terminase large subunit-like protein
MANPLKIKENYDEIKANRDKALNKSVERVEYLTKHLNHFLPSNSGEEFITLEKLRLCKATEAFNWKAKHVYIGIDLAAFADNTSVIMACYENDIINFVVF